MPLIEPLEYKDVKRIREFVIAIDTSGSVMGEQEQAFLQKTYNILQSTESFFQPHQRPHHPVRRGHSGGHQNHLAGGV